MTRASAEWSAATAPGKRATAAQVYCGYQGRLQEESSWF
jgi:hypothetical protein